MLTRDLFAVAKLLVYLRRGGCFVRIRFTVSGNKIRGLMVQDENCLLTTTSRQDTLSRLNTVGLTQGRCHVVD